MVCQYGLNTQNDNPVAVPEPPKSLPRPADPQCECRVTMLIKYGLDDRLQRNLVAVSREQAQMPVRRGSALSAFVCTR